MDTEGVIRANEDGTVTASRIKLEVWGGVLSVELCEIEIYNDDGSIPAPPPTSYEEPVQVKGENYALGKAPIASGSAYENTVDAWGMICLTDGKKLVSEANGGSNGWMAQAMPGSNCEPNTCWGGVDLAAVYTINEVHNRRPQAHGRLRAKPGRTPDADLRDRGLLELTRTSSVGALHTPQGKHFRNQEGKC